MNHDEGSKPEVGSLTGDEVAKHNSKDSCWVIVHGKAYDVTEFLPGTRRIINMLISANSNLQNTLAGPRLFSNTPAKMLRKNMHPSTLPTH
jgi:hypothetical protein